MGRREAERSKRGRVDKLVANFLTFIKLAAIRMWLSVYES